jgi:hypothetical protein
MFTCEVCQKQFTLRHNMLRHLRTHVEDKLHECKTCKKSFSRKSDLMQHMNFVCRSNAPTNEGKKTSLSEEPSVFNEVEKALKNRIKTFATNPGSGDLQTTLQKLKYEMENKIKGVLQTHTALKFNIFVETEFTNVAGEFCQRSFKTKNAILYKTSDAIPIIEDGFQKLLAEKGEGEMKKSGWNFHKVKRVEIRINKYNPLRGSRFVQLPKRILDRRAVINVKNTDDFCFKYAILSKYVTKDPWRVSNYINNEELQRKYNWNCISFPVKINDIKQFETVNNVSVNLFGLNEQDDVYPLKICEEEMEDHFDLLYVTDMKTSHYCYITEFERLVHSQYTSNHNQIKICKSCFAHFKDHYGQTAVDKLAKHKVECLAKNAARCEFPPYDTISFKNAHRSKKVRFVIYADFETILQPVASCQGDPEKSWTSSYQRHIPYSYAYLLKDSENEHTKLRLFRGEEAAKHFMQSITEDIKFIDNILYRNKKLDVPKLTPTQQDDFNSATVCHVCNKGNFTAENCKVRNHCHVSGKYLGVAHRRCNLFYPDQHFIPCFIHNLSGYDAHFIIRELG